MKKFEYKSALIPRSGWQPKIDINELDVILNTYAKDGWEFFQILQTTLGESTSQIIVLFRREVL
jgi:Domain of unknown function (DUF4177)